jgi:hypothetical protein
VHTYAGYEQGQDQPRVAIHTRWRTELHDVHIPMENVEIEVKKQVVRRRCSPDIYS